MYEFFLQGNVLRQGLIEPGEDAIFDYFAFAF
jgi:hypothetical protein